VNRPVYQWTDEARVRVQSAGLTVELVDAALAAPSGLRRDTDTGALRVVTGMTDDARVIAVLSVRQAGTNRFLIFGARALNHQEEADWRRDVLDS
jgi:hypothetical protein